MEYFNQKLAENRRVLGPLHGMEFPDPELEPAPEPEAEQETAGYPGHHGG